MSPAMFAGFLAVTCLGYTHAAFKTCYTEKGNCDSGKYLICKEGPAYWGGYGKFKIHPQGVDTIPANVKQCTNDDASHVDPNTLMCHNYCITNKKVRVGYFKTRAGTTEEKWVPVQAMTDDTDKNHGILWSGIVWAYGTNKEALATSAECGV